ncbi:hypothetical protein Tco_0739134 [Tanacetum coccineum]
MEAELKAKEEKRSKEAKKAMEAELKAKKDKKAKEAEVISISIIFKAPTTPTPTRSNFTLPILPQDPELPLHPLLIKSCFYCSKRVQENSYDRIQLHYEVGLHNGVLGLAFAKCKLQMLMTLKCKLQMPNDHVI